MFRLWSDICDDEADDDDGGDGDDDANNDDDDFLPSALWILKNFNRRNSHGHHGSKCCLWRYKCNTNIHMS